MKVFSVFLCLFAVSMLADAATGRWAFDLSVSGPGWVILDIVIAAACAVAAYGLWRRANRGKPWLIRLRAACRGAHAVHAFETAGRLLGLSGAVLLASAVASAHRWEELQQNWERSVPFGILALIFLSAGISQEVRRTVLPVLGVVASIVITLPFGNPAHGAWGMFLAAVSLLAFGGVVLVLALREAARPEEAGKEPESGVATFARVLGGVGVLWGAVLLFYLHSGGLAPAGWWGLGVLVSAVLAIMWEVLLTPANGGYDGPSDHRPGATQPEVAREGDGGTASATGAAVSQWEGLERAAGTEHFELH